MIEDREGACCIEANPLYRIWTDVVLIDGCFYCFANALPDIGRGLFLVVSVSIDWTFSYASSIQPEKLDLWRFLESLLQQCHRSYQ